MMTRQQSPLYYLSSLVLLLLTPAAAAAYTLDPDKFAQHPLATSSSSTTTSTPISVSFWTTPNAHWDNRPLLDLQALIVRFAGATTSSSSGNGTHMSPLVEFTPYMYIADGTKAPLRCREPDSTNNNNSTRSHVRADCHDHCMNVGRYCDSETIVQGHVHKMMHGHDIVQESVRRMCVWNVQGQHDPMAYFAYLQALVDTGCDKSTNDNDACWTQVYQAAGIINDYNFNNVDAVKDCMFGLDGVGPFMGQDTNMQHPVLEDLVHKSNALTTMYPLLQIDSTDSNTNEEEATVVLHEGTLNPSYGLQAICKAFPNQNTKPKICGFCAEFCPRTTSTYNVNQCLWELQCGGDGNNNYSFDDWVSGKVGAKEAMEGSGDTLPPLPEDAAEKEKAQQEQQQWVAVGFVDENGKPHAYDGQTLPPHPNKKNNQDDSNNDDNDDNKGYFANMGSAHIFVLIVASAAALGACCIALYMLIRMCRVKWNIHRAEREQQHLQSYKDDDEEHGIFPDEFDLDLDLAGLQYSDYVPDDSFSSSSSREQPATAATRVPPKFSFLPKIA